MKKFAKILSVVLCLAMVASFAAMAFAADDSGATYTKVAASDVTAGTYLIYGVSGTAMDDGSNSAFMTVENCTDTRLMGASLTVDGESVTTDDANCAWELIETEGGFYVKSVALETYLYWPENGGNKIYQTADVAEASVWAVTQVEKEVDGVVITGYTLATGARGLSANRFGSKGDFYLGFAAYDYAKSTCLCMLEFYKLSEGSVVVPDTTAPETTAPETTVPAATIKTEVVSALSNGDKVYIYYPAGSEAMSATANGKKLAGVAASVDGDYVMITEGAAELTVSVDENGYYSFICDGKYLTSGETGNSLTFADAASDYSLWVLEEVDGGWYVMNANAKYGTDPVYPQYLEYYSGFTTYSLKETSNVAYYTYQFCKVVTEEEPPVETEPVAPETTAPVAPETTAPVAPETTAPVAPETTAPVAPETTAPVADETTAATEPAETEPAGGEDNKPGDNGILVLAVCVMLASAAGVVALTTKKRAF